MDEADPSQQSLSAQVTYAAPMHAQSTGTLSLSNNQLTFTDDQGAIQFQCPINDITKVKDHNSAQLTVYDASNKPHYIYFSTSKDAIISGARFGHISEWTQANAAALPIIKPWIDYFQQQGVLIHGPDAVKNQRLQVGLIRAGVVLLILALIFGLLHAL